MANTVISAPTITEAFQYRADPVLEGWKCISILHIEMDPADAKHVEVAALCADAAGKQDLHIVYITIGSNSDLYADI